MSKTEIPFRNFVIRLGEARNGSNFRCVFFVSPDQAAVLLLADGRRKRIGIHRLDRQNCRSLIKLGFLVKLEGNTQNAVFGFDYSKSNQWLEFRPLERKNQWFEIVRNVPPRNGEWRGELMQIVGCPITEIVAKYETEYSVTDTKRRTKKKIRPTLEDFDAKMLAEVETGFSVDSRKITTIPVLPSEAVTILEFADGKRRKGTDSIGWRTVEGLYRCGFLVVRGKTAGASTMVSLKAAAYVRFKGRKPRESCKLLVGDGQPDANQWRKDLENIAVVVIVPKPS